MITRITLIGAALLGLSSALPNAAPQVQYNTASVNTSGADKPSATAEVTPPSPIPSSYGGAAASHYVSPAFVPHGQSLKPSLSQQQTNGNSPFGTFQAPKLPPFLTGGPLPQGFPWGSRTAQNTDPYTNPPNTGVTRYYNFDIAEQTIAPDGVERQGFLINGQFPGPTIEANWGDWIEVTVNNQLASEGTTLHWHGLLQTATPYFDGVPSVQMCPIAPGGTFTYRFKADLYGTSWYHSHYSAQYANGLFGAMIIYGPEHYSYDVDIGPVFLTDWYHEDYYTLVEQVMAPISEGLPPPHSNNNLINGKMNYPCANATGLKCTPNAGISKFSFTTGKSYRLRLINAGAEGIQKFSIDGYEMTVIANDFVPITPYTTNVVTLGIGQRSDVIVKATGNATDAVWMRSTLGPVTGGCALTDGVSPEAVAAIYYQNANTSALPTTVSTVPESAIVDCNNDPLASTVPLYSITPTTSPQTSQNIDIEFQSNGTNYLFYMNNSTFRADYNDPILLEAKLGKTSFAADANVYDFGKSQSIRIIVYNYAPTGYHPMHLHGHNMYVLAVGQGTWDGTVTNPSNPQRRDVQLLPVANGAEPGYMVMQFDADNPGVWPFHCHIAWHVSAGLYINILERPDLIVKNMQIPSIMAQTCRDWSAWTGDHIPNEIDSGL